MSEHPKEPGRWLQAYEAVRRAPDARNTTFGEMFAERYRDDILPTQLNLWDKAIDMLIRYGSPLLSATYHSYPSLNVLPLSTGALALASEYQPDEHGTLVVPAVRVSITSTQYQLKLPLRDITKAQTRSRRDVRELAALRAAKALAGDEGPNKLTLEAFLLSNNAARLRNTPNGGNTQGLKESKHSADTFKRLLFANLIDTSVYADDHYYLRKLKYSSDLSTFMHPISNAFGIHSQDQGPNQDAFVFTRPSSQALAFQPPTETTDEAYLKALTAQLTVAQDTLAPVSEALSMLANVSEPAKNIGGLLVPGILKPF